VAEDANRKVVLFCSAIA